MTEREAVAKALEKLAAGLGARTSWDQVSAEIQNIAADLREGKAECARAEVSEAKAGEQECHAFIRRLHRRDGGLIDSCGPGCLHLEVDPGAQASWRYLDCIMPLDNDQRARLDCPIDNLCARLVEAEKQAEPEDPSIPMILDLGDDVRGMIREEIAKAFDDYAKNLGYEDIASTALGVTAAKLRCPEKSEAEEPEPEEEPVPIEEGDLW